MRIHQRLSIDVARSVADKSVDVGITTDRQYSTALTKIPQREALEHEIIRTHPGSFNYHQLMRVSARPGCSPKVRMMVSGYEAMCLMVAAGNGIGCLPSKVAQLYAHALTIRLIPLSDAFTKSRYVICIRDRNALSSAARRLVENLEASEPS